MIYIPTYDQNNNYAIIYDKDTIRVYDTPIILDQENTYTDYYINSHYISKNGSETIISDPVCILSENITDQVYYRSDFPDILLTFILLSLVIFYLPIKILFRLFRRFN